MNKLFLLLSILLVLPTSAKSNNPAEPTGWMWGLGVSASQDVYTDFDNRVIPIPLLGYRGERLSVYGPFISYRLFEHNGLSFSADLTPVFAGYEEGDSPVLAGMEDRDFSVGLGASIGYSQGGWELTLAGNFDVLDTFNGYQAKVGISRRFIVGQFMLEPSIGVNYQDSNYVDYYYGVTAQEATSSRPEYIADDAFNTEVGVAISTRQLFGGMTRLQFSTNLYDDSIADSPITNDDSDLSVQLIFTRFF